MGWPERSIPHRVRGFGTGMAAAINRGAKPDSQLDFSDHDGQNDAERGGKQEKTQGAEEIWIG